MTAPKEYSRDVPEKKPAPQLKSVPETGVQKAKDLNPGGSHNQDADRHRGMAHKKSGK